MTRLESVLAQALELDETDREILVIQVSQSLTDAEGGELWSDPAFIAHLREVSRHADEHPETLMEWADAEKEIFGDRLKQ